MISEAATGTGWGMTAELELVTIPMGPAISQALPSDSSATNTAHPNALISSERFIVVPYEFSINSPPQ
jgi:hypothetical protein